MWREGLNKSKISIRSREESEERGEKMVQPYRVRNRRLCEHGGEESGGEGKGGRSLSKSSIQGSKVERRGKVEVEKLSQEGKQYSQKGEDSIHLIETLLQGNVLVSNGVKLCESYEEQRFPEKYEEVSRRELYSAENMRMKHVSASSSPIRKSSASISTQTEHPVSLTPTSVLISPLPLSPSQTIATLLSKLAKTEKMNNLYMLKIAQIQIDYQNLKSSISHQIAKMKEEISSGMISLIKELEHKQSGQKQETAWNVNEVELKQKVERGDMQRHIRSIMNDVSELKRVFKVKSRRDPTTKGQIR